jgi:hypothetical protein
MIAALLVSAAAAASPIAQAPLRPLAFLIGHCWASSGSKERDKHCFEPVYGGQHVRDRHAVTVDGKEVYAGETLYSTDGKGVVFTYWNSLGGLGTGMAVLNGDEWRFSGSIHGMPGATEQPMAVTWKIRPDGYEVTGSGSPEIFKLAD